MCLGEVPVGRECEMTVNIKKAGGNLVLSMWGATILISAYFLYKNKGMLKEAKELAAKKRRWEATHNEKETGIINHHGRPGRQTGSGAGGMTPLESASTPNMERLLQMGMCGNVYPIAPGIPWARMWDICRYSL